MRFSPEQLSDPKCFDALRQDKETFSSLAELEHRDDLSHLELCRLAQYLLSQKDAAGCLATLAKARELDSSYLERGIYLACLGFKEDFRALAAALRPIKFESMEPLEMEGCSLVCESIALYYLAHLEDYQQAYAMLYRAETLAALLNLNYRLDVISSKLEYTASLADDSYIPNPLTSDSDAANEQALRNSFSNFLIDCDIDSVERLAIAGQLEKTELILVQATKDYALALEGKFSYEKVAEKISEAVPDYYESKLYWSLLMLQTFSIIGNCSGRSHPERIVSVLKEALGEFVHLNLTMTLAAKIYPLGVYMAASLDDRIKPHIYDVMTLQNERHGDGFNLGNKVVSGVTKPVREAIILDELYGTTDNLITVTKKPLGHPQNKSRLEKSMKAVDIGRSNFISVGGLYRGVYCLGKALTEPKIQEEAEHIYQGSTFLKEVVSPHLLNF